MIDCREWNFWNISRTKWSPCGVYQFGLKETLDWYGPVFYWIMDHILCLPDYFYLYIIILFSDFIIFKLPNFWCHFKRQTGIFFYIEIRRTCLNLLILDLPVPIFLNGSRTWVICLRKYPLDEFTMVVDSKCRYF